MSFVQRPHSPPPPMPSPQLVPTPLPSPPPLHRKPSPSRLTIPANHSPPIPPRLIGSPLLQKTLNASKSHDRLDRKAKEGLFGEDDEFGARRRALGRKSNSSISSLPTLSPSPTRATRRSPTQSSRCRSPPPSLVVASPPPPVPPIPAFMLTPTDKKSSLQSFPKRETAPAHHTIFDLYTSEDASSLPRTRCESTPHAPSAMTCMEFFTIHNAPRRDCRV
ncbi:hypothetical protein K503DRAFT_764951 [Rhizopogon vinicolor AM-OR11-026]|uniref:Uncharacterized protein n=1 Tax=Rhizopogon vinicolor AM-OR11-026 TaxID=1314800 RepID=A0A1B7NI05_9AGAM|nr:hypothetical protein K503DRAFT_764951 [Rhizopogon vinicolor AM-OR11-026]